MKKSDKEELRGLKLNKLQDTLQELETERMKLEVNMRFKNGSSTLVRNYPSAKAKLGYGNIKKMRKTIAFIKSLVHTKMMQQGYQ